MKKMVSLRMTIKNINGVILCQMNTYGAQLDTRTILAEGRYFKAGKKAGFGKTCYTFERANGQWHKVIIDRIEEVA